MPARDRCDDPCLLFQTLKTTQGIMRFDYSPRWPKTFAIVMGPTNPHQ